MTDVIERLAPKNTQQEAAAQPEVVQQAPTEPAATITDTAPVEQVQQTTSAPSLDAFHRFAEIFNKSNSSSGSTGLASAQEDEAYRSHFGRKEIKGDTTIDKLANVGVATLEATSRIVTGGAHLFAGAEASLALSKATDMSSLYSEEHQQRKEMQAEEFALYDKELNFRVKSGRMSEGEAEVLRGLKAVKQMTGSDIAELAGTVAGSFIPLILAAKASPLAFAGAVAITGAATVAEAVTSVRDSLYEVDALKNYTTPHDVLMLSSESTKSKTYAKVFAETGSETEARAALYEELRDNTATDPRVLASAAAETMGDVALLYMGGALKGLKQAVSGAGKTGLLKGVGTGIKEARAARAAAASERGLLKQWLMQGSTESVLEGGGSGTRTYVANEIIKENANPEHKLTKNLGQVAIDALAGLGSGPVMSATNAAITTAQIPGAIAGAIRNRDKEQEAANTSAFRIQEPGEAITTEASEIIQSASIPTEATEGSNPLDTVKTWISTDREIPLSETSKKYVPDNKGAERVFKSLIAAVSDPKTSIEDATELYADLLTMSNGAADSVRQLRGVLAKHPNKGVERGVNYIDSMLESLNDPTLEVRRQEIIEHANKLTVSKDEQGAKNLRIRMAIDPGSLTGIELEMFDPTDTFVTATDMTKINLLKNGLEQSKQINEAAKAAGMNKPVNLAHREIVTEGDMSKGGGKKGLSVLGHSLGIIDLMARGDLAGAKLQLGKLERLAQSQRNKAAALRKGIADNATSVQYQTFGQNYTTPWTFNLKIVAGSPNLALTVETELEFIEWAHNSLVDQYGADLGSAINYTGKNVQPTTPTGTDVKIPTKSFKKVQELYSKNRPLFDKLTKRIKKELGLDLTASDTDVQDAIKGLKSGHLERLVQGIDSYFKEHQKGEQAKRNAARKAHAKAEKAVRDLIKKTPTAIKDHIAALSGSFSKVEMGIIESGKFQNLNQNQLEKLHTELGKLVSGGSKDAIVREMNTLFESVSRTFNHVNLPRELLPYIKADAFSSEAFKDVSVAEMEKLRTLLETAVSEEKAQAEADQAAVASLVPTLQEILDRLPKDDLERGGILEPTAHALGLTGIREVMDGTPEALSKLSASILEAWIDALKNVSVQTPPTTTITAVPAAVTGSPSVRTPPTDTGNREGSVEGTSNEPALLGDMERREHIKSLSNEDLKNEITRMYWLHYEGSPEQAYSTYQAELQAEQGRRAQAASGQSSTPPTPPAASTTAVPVDANAQAEDAAHLAKGRADTTAKIKELDAYPEAYNEFFKAMEARLGERITELEKLIDGTDNSLSLVELRTVYQAANRHLKVVAPRTPTTPPVSPTGSQEQAKSAKEQLLETITKAIADKASNVRMVKMGAVEKAYVLIDGVVYNENGKAMVAKRILDAFNQEDVIDPDADIPPVDEDADIQEDTQVAEVPGQTEADALAKQLPISRAVRFLASKTRIFMPGWVNSLVGILKNHREAPMNTLGNYFDAIGGKVDQYFGGYDRQGNPVGFIAKIHEKMNRYDIARLAREDAIAPRKRLHRELEALNVVPGLTASEFVTWLENTFTAKQKGVNDADRLAANKKILIDLVGEAEANRLTKDVMAIDYPELRFVDLLYYDGQSNTFGLPLEVKAAVSAALVDMVGNYTKYATTYQDEHEFKESFGLTGNSVKYLDYRQKGEKISSVSYMAKQGVVTFKNATYALAKTADLFLGVQGSNRAGSGLTKSPMQSLMGSVLHAYLTDPNPGNLAKPMKLQEMILKDYTEDGKRKTERITILMGNQTSVIDKTLQGLRLAGDALKRIVLIDPERTRYINQVPKARTTNTEGDRLTKRQQHNLEVQNAVPFKVNGNMHNLWTNVLGIQGAIDLLGNYVNRDVMNIGDATSKEGKNTQLINAITELQAIAQEIKELGLSPEEATIYYNNSVSVVSRIMIDGGYTPQGDKLIRSAISPNGTQVDATGLVDYLTSGSVDTATDLQTFYTLAIAQAFGMKIQNMREGKNLANVQKLFKDSDFVKVARAWYAASQEKGALSDKARAKLIKDSKAMTSRLGLDLNEVGLQTLVEVGALLTEGTDLKNFTTHAYVEADGLTNGPFMAGYLAGIDVTDPNWIQFMANSGFFFGTAQTGNEFRAARFESTEEGVVKPDNYLNVANAGSVLMEEFVQTLQEKISSSRKLSSADKVVALKTSAAMKYVLSHAFEHISLGENGAVTFTRNTAKSPVTVTFYGASASAISARFLSELQDYVYELSTLLYTADIDVVANMVFPGEHLTSEQKLKNLRELIESINLISERHVNLNHMRTDAYLTRNTYLANKPFIFIPENDLSLLKGHPEHLLRHYYGDYLENTKKNIQAHLTQHLVGALKELAGSTLEAKDAIATTTNAFSIAAATLFTAKVNALKKAGSYDAREGLSPSQMRNIKKEMRLYGISGSIADQLFTMVKEVSQDVAAHKVSSLGVDFGEGSSGFYSVENTGVAGIPRFIISQGDAAVANYVLSQAQEIIGNHFLQVYDGFNFGANNYKEGNQLVNDAARATLTPRAMVSLFTHMVQNMEKMTKELLKLDVSNFEEDYTIADDLYAYQMIDMIRMGLTNSMGKEAADLFVNAIVRAYSGDPTPFTTMDGDALASLGERLAGEPIRIFPRIAATAEDVIEAVDRYLGPVERTDTLNEEVVYKLLIADEPLLAGTTYADLKAGRVNFEGTYVELDTGHYVKEVVKDKKGKKGVRFVQSPKVIMSMKPLQRVMNRVVLGHEVLSRTQNHIDQYAGAGQVSSKTTGVVISEDVNEAAEQLAEIQKEVLAERAANKTPPAPLQELSGEKVDAVFNLLLPGSTTRRRTITDGTRLSRLMYQVASAFKTKDANDLRVQLSERMAKLLQRRMEQGMRFVYDPTAKGSVYSPATDTMTVTSLAPEVILHEAMHALTANTLLDYYQGNTEKIPESVKVAIRNLEILLDEFKGTSETTTNHIWAQAKAHIQAAGMKAVNAGKPHLAKALEISELVSVVIGSPLLATELQHTPVRSKLHTLVGKVIEFLRTVLRVPERVEDQSFFQAMSSNALLISNFGSYVPRHVEPAPVVLEMFEPENQTTYVAAKELADTVNVVFANKRAVKAQADLIADVKNTDMGGEFAAAGFNLSANQQRAVNVLAAGIAAGVSVNPDGQRELYRMGAHIMSKLTPEHFGNTSAKGSVAWYRANDLHRAVTGSSNKRAAIPAIIALTMVSDEFKGIVDTLGFPKAEQTEERESSFEKRLGQLGYDAIHALNTAVNQPNTKVPSVAIAKVLSAVKKPDGVAAQLADLPQSLLRDADKYVSNVLEHVGQSLGEAGRAVSSSDKSLPKALGVAMQTLGALLDSETAAGVSKSIHRSLNSSNAYHALKDLVRDAFGRNKQNAAIYDMVKIVRSFIQRVRQMHVSGAPKNIYKHFTKRPSDEVMEKLTDVMYRTDLGALVSSSSSAAVVDLLTNKTSLARRLRVLEDNILQSPQGQHRLDKANQLAHFMVTSETGNMLLTSATSIVRGDALPLDMKTPLNREDVQLVDEYVTLLAFSNSDNEVFSEMAKTERTALEYSLAFLQGLRAGDLDVEGYPVGVKGHVHTVLGGNIKILTDAEAQRYSNQGYKRVADYIDPETGRVQGGYYFNTLQVQRPFSQGIIQNIIPTANGIDVDTNQHIGERFLPIRGLQQDTLTDVVQSSKGKYGVVPIFDRLGNIIGASRVIDPEVVALRQGERRLAEVAGIHRGRQIEESLAPLFNRAIVDELDGAYENSTEAEKAEFVDLLDPATAKANPVWGDALKVLSPNAKAYAKDKYGRLMVSRGMFTQVVGYRQMGLGDIWSGNTAMNPKLRKGIQRAVEAIVGPRAYYLAMKADELLSGVAAGAKRIIIVKSVIVPVLNALCNVLHLLARSVPLRVAIREAGRKLAEVEEYSKGSKRIVEIEADLLVAMNDPVMTDKLLAEKNAITEYHKKLSIWPLLEAGEFSSIIATQVENDVEGLQKGKVAEYLENQVNKLDGVAKTVAKNLLLSEDSAVFQGLQKTVDYGDFIAKAILYDHRTKTLGHSHDRALGTIREEFINYDFLPGRIRGALERLGLLWFFNYKVRSVKVMMAMLKENPVSLLMISALPNNTWFGSIDTPLTANLVTQFAEGNLGYSIGPEMGLDAPRLHPLVQLMSMPF